VSGLVAVWRRDKAPIAPHELDGPRTALAHRGPDGCDTITSADWVLAHHHFWTTPEEVGERQPLSSADGRVVLAFDGRLDNRDELLRELGPDDANISDAALLGRAFERWGESCFARLLGPFAACVLDIRTGTAVLARDPLGDRTLFYHLSDRLLVAASEEGAVLAHPEVPSRLDETTLARLYAVEAPVEGATLFADVREVPPGHLLVLGPHRVESRPFWTPPEVPTLRLRSDREYADAFRELLGKAVVCRMRACSPVGVMMSGGLDSTPLACLAAQEMTRAGDSRPLRVFSWVFDELPCDERLFMDAVIERHGLEAHRIVGDTLWPLRDAAAWRHEPPPPAPAPYRSLHESVWREAQSVGVEVLLSGTFGDELFSGGEMWLLDLLRERRVGDAAASLSACLARRGPRGVWRDPGLRRVVGDALRAVGRRRPRPTVAEPRPWLTPAVCEVVANAERRPSGSLPGAGGRVREIASPWVAHSAPLTAVMSTGHRIDVRTPYRDRRLVEFIASVPGHQIYRGGLRKHILREAMRGILPDRVRLRRRPTSYLPLYNRGFFERERGTVQTLLQDPDAWWPRFVRREWLENAIRRPLRLRDDGVAAAVPWLCVVVEMWRRTASPAERASLRLP